MGRNVIRASSPRRPTGRGLDAVKVGRRASADAGGADAALLDGYVELLASVAGDGRRLGHHDLDHRRAAGIAAAEQGVSLGSLVDLHLSATWIAWPDLPLPTGAQGDAVATAVLRAANDAIVALIDGYESAQRAAIRYEEAVRREFIDDLLAGVTNPSRLLALAARFGLQLAGTYAVAVVTAEDPFADGDERTRTIEAALMSRIRAEAMLIATKEDRLVCLMPVTVADPAAELAAALDGVPRVRRVAIGRPHAGPAGVARSYREARDVLDVAERLNLAARVLRAADLLVFQVLLRDRAAITDLVATVLEPLRSARGGPGPLVDTLAAYYDAGNAVAAARRLHVGVRTVTYRLQRIRGLTGYDATDPVQRFALETAVQGARLLRWPQVPLDKGRA